MRAAATALLQLHAGSWCAAPATLHVVHSVASLTLQATKSSDVRKLNKSPGFFQVPPNNLTALKKVLTCSPKLAAAAGWSAARRQAVQLQWAVWVRTRTNKVRMPLPVFCCLA